MSVALAEQQVEENRVLAKAVLRAGEAMGLSQTDVGRIIGKDRSSISRFGIDPTSKPGELALLLVRCFRSLHALVGGDAEAMKHWMKTDNRRLGIPREQIRSVQGLVDVVAYLDALRAKS